MKNSARSRQLLTGELWELAMAGRGILAVSHHVLLGVPNLLREDAARAADGPEARQEGLDRSLEKYGEFTERLAEYPGIIPGEPVPLSDIRGVIDRMKSREADAILSLNPHNKPANHLDHLLLDDARNSGCLESCTPDRGVWPLDGRDVLGGMRVVHPQE